MGMIPHRWMVAVAGACLLAGGCGPRPAPGAGGAAPAALDVRIVADEADAALAILERRSRGEPIPESAWTALFASEGYRRLQQREAAMNRAFTDASFRAFLLSDEMARRATALAIAVPRYRALDMARAAARAVAYLPSGARIQARLYPLIKPIPNSFIFSADSVAGIFLNIDPGRTAAQDENTLAHELHHIGFGTVCDMRIAPGESDAVRTLRQRLFGFGEGLAMLAAAGGPEVHPHAASDTADRNRWDRDVADIATAFRTLDGFFLDVLDGRITQSDSVVSRAMTFYGVQGPWYTVGWTMASTIERAFGRDRLKDVMCDPARLMTTYNAAAEALDAKGPAGRGAPPGARWSENLLSRLGARGPTR